MFVVLPLAAKAYTLKVPRFQVSYLCLFTEPSVHSGEGSLWNLNSSSALTSMAPFTWWFFCSNFASTVPKQQNAAMFCIDVLRRSRPCALQARPTILIFAAPSVPNVCSNAPRRNCRQLCCIHRQLHPSKENNPPDISWHKRCSTAALSEKRSNQPTLFHRNWRRWRSVKPTAAVFSSRVYTWV